MFSNAKVAKSVGKFNTIKTKKLRPVGQFTHGYLSTMILIAFAANITLASCPKNKLRY